MKKGVTSLSRASKKYIELSKIDPENGLGEPGGIIPDLPAIGKDHNPGRGIHRRKVEEFEGLAPKEQNEAIRNVWKSVAMGIAHRAKQFSTVCSPKDFGRLYQLVMSGAVSIDKAFPPKEQLQSPKLIVNLFQSLGQRAARIAIPEVPTIDVTPQKVEECPQKNTEPVPPVSGSTGSTA